MSNLTSLTLYDNGLETTVTKYLSNKETGTPELRISHYQAFNLITHI